MPTSLNLKYVFENIFPLLIIILLITIATLSITVYTCRVSTSMEQGITVAIDGDPSEWPDLPKLHKPVSIDGDPSEWSLGILATMDNNTYTVSNGEFIWKDMVGDERTDFYNPDPGVDIISFHVTSNKSHLMILVRFRDLGDLGVDGSPAILIALDTDMNYTNGERWLALYSDTNTSQYGLWDYQIVVDLARSDVVSGIPIRGGPSGSDALIIYDSSWNDVSSSSSVFVADNSTDCVEIAIAWGDVGVSNPSIVSNVRFTVAIVHSNGHGDSWDLGGGSVSDVLDCITSYGTNTWDDVQDQVIDGDGDPATDSGFGRAGKGFIDIGFNSYPEPATPYVHYDLNSGYVVVVDGFNDHRDDKIRIGYGIVEDWDVDIIEWRMLINTTTNTVYFLIHLHGRADIAGNITPAIAIVLDYTPLDPGDGCSEWVYSPSGWGDTDTNMSLNGTPAKWQYIIWFEPERSVGAGNKVFVLRWTGGTGYTESTTGSIAYTTHYIEFQVPADSIGGLNNLSRPFRAAMLTYGYDLDTDSLIDIDAANTYDVAPGGFKDLVPTPGNPDYTIDTVYIRKLTTRIIDIGSDSSNYTIGEPIKVWARLEYYNLSTSTWEPLKNSIIDFYLIGSTYYLGSNTTNTTGYATLKTKIPYTTTPGNYTLTTVYNETQLYLGSTGNKTTKITITHATAPLPEPAATTVLAITTILITIWKKRR